MFNPLDESCEKIGIPSRMFWKMDSGTMWFFTELGLGLNVIDRGDIANRSRGV